MSTSLLQTSVWPDWQAIEARQARENARLWRYAQFAVVGSTLIGLLIAPVRAYWLWRGLAYVLMLALVLWLPPLWFMYRTEADIRRAIKPMLTVCLTLMAITALSYLIRAAWTLGWVRGWGLLLLLPFALAVPVATWFSLRWLLHQRFPDQAWRLGITGRRWPLDTAVGAAAGCALGVHLLLMSNVIPNMPARTSLPPAAALLTLCALMSPLTLGEEVLFRGLGVHLLSGSEQSERLRTALRIGLLNLYIYLLPVVWPASPQSWVWRLIYGGLLAFTATALRFRLGSVLPGMACNVVLSLFMVLATGS